MAEPFGVQLLESRLRSAVSKRLAKIRKSGVAKPGGDGPDARSEAARARNIRFWPRTNREMLAGAKISSVASMESAGGPGDAALRKLDRALARVAVTHDARRDATRTRWSFTPTVGGLVRVTLPDGACSDPGCPKHQYGKLLRWGSAGAVVATKSGYLDAVWPDMRPVPPEEAERLRLREEAEHAKVGDRAGLRGRQDIVPGVIVTAVPESGDEVRGVVEALVLSRDGWRIVVRTAFGMDAAFKYEDIVQVTMPEEL